MRKCALLVVVLAVFAVFAFSAGCSDTGGDDEIRGGTVAAGVDLKSPDEGQSYNLTILHTNDLHGSAVPFGLHDTGGLARIAWLSDKIRSANRREDIPTLLLDAGDVRDGTTFNDGTRAAGMWDIMNRIGYDATAIGNHDHLFGIESLYWDMNAAFGEKLYSDQFGNTHATQNMKVLWGNIDPSRVNNCGDFIPLSDVVKNSIEPGFEGFGGGDPCDAGDYSANLTRDNLAGPGDNESYLFRKAIFKDYGDLRVGIFGVVTDEVIYTVVPGQPMIDLGPVDVPAGTPNEGAIFYSPDPTVSDYVNQMLDYMADPNGDGDTDDGADVVICLSHAGYSTDKVIAARAVGPVTGRAVDIVVGGHSHTQINVAEEIDHNFDSGSTWVVQADWGGKFLGRADLQVAAGSARVVNSGLIQVDSRVPEVQGIKDRIRRYFIEEDGINDFYEDVYGVLPSDLVGYSEVDLNYTDFKGETPLTNLIAQAFLWKGQSESLFTIPDNGNPDAGQPGHLDFSVMVPFVLHGEETIMEGRLTVEDIFDTLHIHDLSRDPTNSDTMHVMELTPLPPGGVDLPFDYDGDGNPDVHIDNHVEMLLELVYGLPDLLATMGFGEYAPLIEDYIGTLQWDGISFEVDFSGLSFDRVDPASIQIGGQSVDSDQYYYFSINSTIGSFLGPLGSLLAGTLGGNFMNWDAYTDQGWSETNVPEWVALMDYIRYELPAQTITPELVAVKGESLRTVNPDLTMEPWDITFDPGNPEAGKSVTIRSTLLNTGMTDVTASSVTYVYDPTPTVLNDNPDGITDGQTGFSYTTIGTENVTDIPAYSAGQPGSKVTPGVTWNIPADTKPGEYRVCAEITNVVSASPSLPEAFTGNNGGSGLCASVTIR